MSDSMVERVARAIADVNAGGRNPNWRVWIDHARAAIEALREPTEAMVEATIDAGWHDVAKRVIRKAQTRRWQAMIDTALKENDHG